MGGWLRTVRFAVSRRRVGVPIRAYDATTGQWRDVDVEKTDTTRDEFTVATFNVWFDEYHARRRYAAIADELKRDAPDVMVFQEVTTPALDVLLARPWIRAEYRSATVTGRRVGNYGMLILSRLPLEDAVYSRLPTAAARGLLTAGVAVNGARLTVGCVHLDSGKASARLRERQLAAIFEATADDRDVVLLGDFNMRDHEDGGIEPRYRDVWPSLRPDDPGYTEDTSINLMRLDSTQKERHVRFDRVLLKGDGWVAKDIELLGTAPISPTLPRVFPSDHFGVRCRLVRAGTAGH
ncbi:endonuclease/exonuclease/phosphatase family protein [Mycolicibacterium lacusdiani]|uniref:endonuclease/exonuclease/phosphatase family protein n=1 Tax=Mycolicibacterium lacusdiani TaxID=2895283 RepID=UPI001F32F155|nr:endonuclease/exonuclease/phosphatase family protein [Mycolicibacterium lacusdiani]